MMLYYINKYYTTFLVDEVVASIKHWCILYKGSSTFLKTIYSTIYNQIIPYLLIAVIEFEKILIFISCPSSKSERALFSIINYIKHILEHTLDTIK